MIFEETSIPGAFLVRLERHEDERGFFARTWSSEEFQARGLVARLAHTSLSWNRYRGTLRGMHYQVAPFEEVKLVTCVRGALHDVIADLRAGSPTYRKWLAMRLDGERLDSLYVPPGVAHGYITLADDSLVHYQISAQHSPAHSRGIRWDDPIIGIEWPARPTVVSERDAALPLLEPG